MENASGITVALFYQSPLQPPCPEDAASTLRQGMEAEVVQVQRDFDPIVDSLRIP